jgi:hypothetical protein
LLNPPIVLVIRFVDVSIRDTVVLEPPPPLLVTYANDPSGANATPPGAASPEMVAVNALVAVSIRYTEFVPVAKLVTYANEPLGANFTSSGCVNPLTTVDIVFVDVS